MILTVSLVAVASEDSFLFSSYFFFQNSHVLHWSQFLALASHFQLFLQPSKLISVIKSGHLWQQLGARNESQGFEAHQLSV